MNERITREQFVRGVDAIQAYRRLNKAVYDLFLAADVGRIDDLGGGPLLNELTRQLEERCNDSEPSGCSMIEYMLYECGGPVVEADGREFMVNTPELLWDYWQQTGEGPFTNSQTPEAGAGYGTASAPRPNVTDPGMNKNPSNVEKQA